MKQRADLRLAARGGWIEILRLPAAAFGAVARVRSTLYQRRVLPSYDVGVPVVSVGNLSAGGTGKTPMIAWLARELERRGRRPGIVSRGYRAPKSVDGAGAERQPDLNDEARMLADLLPGVLHVQDRDRVAAAQSLASHGIDVVLVDDGFQHRRLARDLDLVLVDALRPFGLPALHDGEDPVRAMLPRGLMREPLSALSRAHAVVITRSDAVDAARLAQLQAALAKAAPGLPIAQARHVPVGLRALVAGSDASEPKDIGSLAGLEIDLLSGIGNPGAFERTVLGLGATIREHRALPDHHAFTPEDLAGLGAERAVLTTAKDAARIALQAEIEAPTPLLVLDVELDIVEGERELAALLDALPESDGERTRASIHEGLHG